MFESGGMSAVGVRAAVTAMASLDTALPDADRIELITAFEELKAAAAAAQARLAVAFDDAQRATQASHGVPTRELGRGVGAQVALARRESPHRGSRHLGLAKALVHEMPATMAHLTAGRVSEWRATLLARETATLTVEHRAEIDARLGPRLPHLSDAQLVHAARALAATLDPAAVAARAARAATQRCVSLRPAPDAMTYLTALLPMAQGVAAYAALDRHARERAATGDPRGRGQVMADTLVERLTGQPHAAAVPVEVHVVVPVQTLAGTGDEPAEIPGHGPISADTVRSLIGTSLEAARRTSRGPNGQRDLDGPVGVWLRALFTSADGTRLVALESRRRHFPDGLARFLRLRDKTCRTPWCDAPIRHTDHIHPAARGGPTTAGNGQGLCAACNQTKESPGWSADITATGLSPGARHRVTITTPTGHTYHSTAPPLLEARTA